MSWFSFVARMTEALAWPAVAAIVAITFRRAIVSTIGTIRSLKLPGGTEMTFGEEMKAIAQQAAAIEPSARGVASKNNARVRELVDMAAVSPTGAVVEAWKDVETAARAIAEASGIRMRSDAERPYFNLQGFLSKNELLPPAEIETFKELRLLRNRAAHADKGEITVEQAREYVRLADRLVDAIETLSAGPPLSSVDWMDK